jgi:hypothetical protein
VALTAGPTFACDKVNQLSYTLTDAAAKVWLNDVMILDENSEASGFGSLPIWRWAWNGENRIEVETDPRGDESRVRISLSRACMNDSTDTRGGNVGTLASFDIEGGAREAQTFTLTDVPDFAYTQGREADRAGLRAAFAELVAAVDAKDIDRILALHRAYLEDDAWIAGISGAPYDAMAAMRKRLEAILPGGKIIGPDPLVITEIHGGKIYRATSGTDYLPLDIEFRQGGEISYYGLGLFWAFIDGEWQVVERE